MVERKNYFVRNFNLLKRRFPDIAAKIAKVDIDKIANSKYKVIASKITNSPILTINGKPLASKYNPEKQAEEYIDAELNMFAGMIILMGDSFGYYLRAIKKKLHSGENMVRSIFIIEKDINIFAMYMTLFDMTPYLKNINMFFMVDYTPMEIEQFLYKLFVENKRTTSFKELAKAVQIIENKKGIELYYDYYLDVAKAIRERMLETIWMFGNDPEDSLIGVENIVKNLKTIVDNPGINELYGKFKGVPGILVSTGPSLDKNIDLLKGLEDKAVIIAADSAFKVLLKHGIKPHFVSTLERIPLVVPYFSDIPEDISKDVWMAACPVIVPEVYEAYSGPTISIYRDFAHFKWIKSIGIDKGTLPTGASCSNMSFSILKALGCDPIILVGQDLAIKRDGQTHASGSDYVQELGKKHILPRNDFFPVPGNYEETVLTTPIFHSFLKSFELDIMNYDGKCINATAGGAKIKGAELMTLEEVIDKYLVATYPILDTIRNNLHEISEEEKMRSYEKVEKLLSDTLIMLQDTINKANIGIDILKKFDNKVVNIKKIEDLDLDMLKKYYQKLRKMIAEIIAPKMFYLFLMHIIQSYLIKTNLDVNGIFFQKGNSGEAYIMIFRKYYSLFETIKRIAKLSEERIKVVFEEVKDLIAVEEKV